MLPNRRGALLVTGGFGLVGSATVRRLADLGRRVVATDLDTPANRKAAATLPHDVGFQWADLTDPDQTGQLVADVAPEAIIHLAALIPPPIYRNRRLARKVNVDATATLVRIAEQQSTPPRWVQASSNAVYGSRNPHRSTEPVGADTPLKASDLYSAHKIAAEEIVRASNLDWVVLRLGGILTTDPSAMAFSTDALYLESLLPTDGKLHSVDVRDVARAFAAAATADVVGEILLIAGDESHRLRQGTVSRALAEARGLKGGLPIGRPGNPDSDADWFVTDWMDTTRAQEALQFQCHSWSDLVAEMRANAGPVRHVLPLFAPLIRALLRRRGAYWNQPGQYADPWGAIRHKWGEPAPDTP